MSASARDWALLVVVTVATIPASAVVWFVGGMSMCGEESYTTPPGSVGDSLCGALVRPVAPWVAVAALPTIVVAAGGIGTIRRGRANLLWLFLGGAYLLTLLTSVAFTASF